MEQQLTWPGHDQQTICCRGATAVFFEKPQHGRSHNAAEPQNLFYFGTLPILKNAL